MITYEKVKEVNEKISNEKVEEKYKNIPKAFTRRRKERHLKVM